MFARGFDRFIDDGPDFVFGLARKCVRDFPAQTLEILVRLAQAFERVDVDECGHWPVTECTHVTGRRS